MADNFVEEILVGLGFEFEGEEGEKFKQQTQEIASVINSISLAAGVATAALFAMSKASASNVDNLGKTAAVIDTSAESLARWGHAAELAGVDGEAAIGMLQQLKSTAQDATRTGSGPFQAYAELGVDFEALSSGALDVSDAMETILANARNMDKAIAQSALNELGIDTRLLELTGSEIEAAFEAADKFSGVTTEMAAASAEFNNQWQGMMVRMGGTANMLTERMLPALTKFLEVMQEGLEWLQTTGLPILDEFVEALGGWETALLTLGGVAALAPMLATLGLVVKLLGLAKVGMLALGGAGAALATTMAPVLAVLAAGAAGAAAGSAIQENLSPENSDVIGKTVARILAAFGNEEAQSALAITGANSSPASIVPITGRGNGRGGSSGGVGGGANRGGIITNNTFNGLNTNDIETLLKNQQRRQVDALANDAIDPVVR